MLWSGKKEYWKLPAELVKKRHWVFTSRNNHMQQISLSLGCLFLVRHNYPVLTAVSCAVSVFALAPSPLLFTFCGGQAVWSSITYSHKRSLFAQNRLFPCAFIFIFSRWLTCLAAFLTLLTLFSSRWTLSVTTWKQPANLHQKSSMWEMWLKWQMQNWERRCLCANMTLYIRGQQKTEAIIACLKTWQIF